MCKKELVGFSSFGNFFFQETLTRCGGGGGEGSLCALCEFDRDVCEVFYPGTPVIFHLETSKKYDGKKSPLQRVTVSPQFPPFS